MDYGATTANELAEACSAAGNQAAWQEFVRRFQRPIALAILRTARGWGEPATLLVEDLVQDTFLRLCADNCRLMRGFVARHPDSIVGYLKVIAANVTHDHFRAQASQKRGGDLRRMESDSDMTEMLPAPVGQARAFETEMQIGEIDRILCSFATHVLPDRDRVIFWLYYRQGYTARDIGAMPSFGLTDKGVESAIHRTTHLLRRAMQLPVAAKGISEPPTI